MTLLQVFELSDYWAEFPPIHEILKAVYKVKAEPKPQHMDFDAMADFMRRTGGKIDGLARG